MNTESQKPLIFSARQIFIAGMVGGSAEILWFMLIGVVLSFNIQDVATGITTSIFPYEGSLHYSASIGVAIHLFLSVLLAALYMITLGRWSLSRYRLFGQLIVGMSALAFVWVVNYFVVLPILNPSFIETTTYSLSLLSKVFFGIAMALTFNYLKGRTN